ncbi:copper resistance CopC/CopD family protein [Paenibacillus sp. SYP-B4298]|uniref:copper resistance CopC/CopD family protein n=1 Tax=Paenibacillus sp. SYP-B4298 TaxID=2996034 RepID=UPI0022DD147F|nr:copper resistance protein CopC [Paenibacillus sp. SYP-B4298]
MVNRQKKLLRAFMPVVLAMLAAMLWAVSPAQVLAHASVELMAPEPNTQMNEPPQQVELRFNEPIEAGFGGVQVLDSMSRTVTDQQQEVSADRRTITLPLPKLGEGVYTVSYGVVSADGHPVSGSYIFVVGNPPNAKDASSFDLHKQLGHTGHGSATEVSAGELLLYLSRGLYYAALLLVAGLMLWYGLLRTKTEVQRTQFDKWGLWTMRALLLTSLFYVFVHTRELMEGQPSPDWLRLFTRTEIGISWLILLALALLGFLVLKSGAVVRMLWAVALLVLESISGHAAAYEPKWYSLLLDNVHLLASAIWAGGLAFLFVLWRVERKDAGRFAEAFSRAAWISIVVLTISGVLSTLLFLPDFSYLFYTSWGVLLVIKTVLVLLVIVTGALLRIRVRRGDLPHSGLLKLDVGLMAAIVLVVGIFTYISPLPANEPFSKHLMGSDKHITLRITPNVPGENKFIVKVWLPEKSGEPKRIKLLLRSLDKPDMGAIELPIEPYEDQEVDTFDGFIKSTYRAEGPYIPFPGQWKAEIRILTQADDEIVHTETFRNY